MNTHKHGLHAVRILVETVLAQGLKMGRHPSRPQTLLKSFENLGINLKVFAPNAFPLVLFPTLSQKNYTDLILEANETIRQNPNQ